MKTTNFENSKKLHEVGFKAKTIFAHSINNPQRGVQSFVIDIGIKDGYYPAYDLETILEALPDEITIEGKHYRMYLTKPNRIMYKIFWYYGGVESIFYFIKQQDESLADTAARLLIKLFEAGIINFKK